MLFYTPTFLIFFASLLLLMGIIHRSEPRKVILLIASYIFYMWWNPAFILLIIFSTVVDFIVGGRMHREENLSKRRILLVISLCANLGMLFFFKYYGFFSDSLLGLMRLFGSEPSWTTLNITLPVGISFYTFQTLSYTIDIYRKAIPATKKPLDFALFVAFFPQLVAGPIVRAATFLPQLEKGPRISVDQTTVFLIVKGLVKKVLIADNLAILSDGVFASPADWTSPIIWVATIAFAIQVYCDFSGYSDIAIGISRILGFRLPRNFNHPYISRNPAEFWQRWHISLSTWLRDYLYFSLGGLRSGALVNYRNILITMLLGGLWHGAGWNFVLWGFLHACMLIGHRVFTAGRPRNLNPSLLSTVVSVMLLQYGVLVTYICFRLGDLDDLTTAVSKFVLFDFNFTVAGQGLGNLAFFSTLLTMLAFVVFHAISIKVGHLENYLGRLRPVPAALVCVGVGIAAFLYWPSAQAPFIYFQF